MNGNQEEGPVPGRFQDDRKPIDLIHHNIRDGRALHQRPSPQYEEPRAYTLRATDDMTVLTRYAPSNGRTPPGFLVQTVPDVQGEEVVLKGFTLGLEASQIVAIQESGRGGGGGRGGQ